IAQRLVVRFEVLEPRRAMQTLRVRLRPERSAALVRAIAGARVQQGQPLQLRVTVLAASLKAWCLRLQARQARPRSPFETSWQPALKAAVGREIAASPHRARRVARGLRS